VLYRVGRVLTSTTGARRIGAEAAKEIESCLGLPAVVFLADPSAGPDRMLAVTGSRELPEDERERAAAASVMASPRATGSGGAGHARTYHVPLVAAGARPLGVLGVLPRSTPPSRRERILLGSLAAQIALALERNALAEEAQRAAIEAESERLRANLLATVSHDLRTPLAAISGSASMLLELERSEGGAEREGLLREIQTESNRLTRMVENLLQLGRLEDGKLAVRKEWYPLEEVLEAALARLAAFTDTRRIQIESAPGLPLVPMDADLMVNVFVNLLDNALRYAPEGPVVVAARAAADRLAVEVSDRGPGLAAAELERVFEPFVRGARERQRGSGLGLAICKAIVTVHGGRITAGNRPAGGAVFRLVLPLEGGPVRGAEPVCTDPAHVVDVLGAASPLGA